MKEQETFSQRYVRLKKVSGISQKEMIERTGLSQPHLSRYDCGRFNNPTLSVMIKLADGLSISLDHLVGRKNSRGLSGSEQIFLNKFRLINVKGKSMLFEIMDTLKKSMKK